jgi:hypothetical protein
MKIISYSLLKLELNAPIHDKQKLYLLNYKELSMTWSNLSIAIMLMDLKLFLMQ